MIELVSEEKINSRDYLEIRCEFIDIWNKIFLQRDRIDNAIFCKFGRFMPLVKAMSLSWRKYYRFVPKYAGSLLNHGLILRSNQLWSVRNWEYPWAILNSKILPDSRILDIGSGWSLFPLYLAHKSDYVDCIDTDELQMKTISPVLADILKVKVNYSVDDALHLSAKDNTYDYVFSISVMEHFEEETENGILINKHTKKLERIAMRECIRVLRPGGRAILTLQYGNEKSDLRSFTFDYFKDLMEEFKSNLLEPVDNYDKFRFTEKNEDEMSRLIAESFPYEPTNRPTGSIGVILTK